MTTITVDIPDHLLPVIDTIGDQLALVLEMGMSRLAPISTQAYIEAIEFLTQNPTSAMIADFRFSDEIEIRINDLLAKNRLGEATMAEEIELDRLVQLEERLQLAKASALAKLAQK